MVFEIPVSSLNHVCIFRIGEFKQEILKNPRPDIFDAEVCFYSSLLWTLQNFESFRKKSNDSEFFKRGKWATLKNKLRTKFWGNDLAWVGGISS